MKRDEFLRQGLALGLGLPFLSSLFATACGEESVLFPSFKTDFSGKIIIVGAGAAGLSAGYLLSRYNIDYEIIEASPVFGGRLKRDTALADFPIDLGAEWIHTNPSVLSNIINNPDIDANIDIIVYNPQTIKTWKNGRFVSHNYIRNFYSEWKFKDTTWYGFFERFLLPTVAEKITYNTPIVNIEYNGEQVILTAQNDQQFTADKVLVTVPLGVLKRDVIAFNPELPTRTKEALDGIFFGDGIKIFVRFKEKFYPDFIAFGNFFKAMIDEEKFVYEAAFRKGSSHHVLGLFAINEKAAAYTNLPSDEAIIAQFLSELDEMFDGKASKNYEAHIIQNWSKEPFIQGAYSYDEEGGINRLIDALSTPLNDKVYFAGEALSYEHQATVHGASDSAFSTIKKMISS